ncbi:MAG: ArsR/SmtB family transcription factor [Anaerovoracaceae bacterium]|jgi:DNA-binding transcriptional ArsR family regulator
MERVYRTDPDSFIELAEILKALGHPQRLCIAKTLCEKDSVNVGDMQHCLGEAQATVSQHLSRLRAANIITGRRDGTNIYYSISNDRAKMLMKAVINEFFSDGEEAQ